MEPTGQTKQKKTCNHLKKNKGLRLTGCHGCCWIKKDPLNDTILILLVLTQLWHWGGGFIYTEAYYTCNSPDLSLQKLTMAAGLRPLVEYVTDRTEII